MNKQEIISSGLLELYALGLASDSEIQEVHSWIAQYPEIADELVSIEKSMESYAFMNAVEPQQSLKDSIFADIEKKKIYSTDILPQNNTKVVRMTPYFNWAAAASFLLLIGSLLFNIVYYNKYKNAEIAQKEAKNELLAQSNDNRYMQNEMNVIRSKYSEPVALHGLPAAPDAAAKIFWMKNTGEVYVDAGNLPAAPAGKQYQLWAMVDGKPVDAGMIIPEKKGDKIMIQKMKSFGKAQAFAITLETTGGNPTPKGTMYVMGEI